MSSGTFSQVTEQPKATLIGEELAVPGQGVVRSRHGGGCFRLQSQKIKAVSLFLTATVSLGGK